MSALRPASQGEDVSNDPAAQELAVRDPLCDTIHLDARAARVVDAPVFQRLRYIRQLGLAHLVYPGATHTLFDHALGVYHLARRALTALGRTDLPDAARTDATLVPLACLLHDIGHFPFSHALEELEDLRRVGDHEAVGARFLRDPDIAAALEGLGPDAGSRTAALIAGRSDSPLAGLVNGSIDLDKIEYLTRDAFFCGVPYAAVDVSRLLHTMMLLPDPASGRLELGVHEKGVAALESLLYAKYQMFRNVYWHHAARAATVLYKRIVSEALRAGLVSPESLVGRTDEELLHELESTSEARGSARSERVARWTASLRARRLPKRAAEVVAADIGVADLSEWLASDNALKRRVEDAIAAELGLEDGGAFLDYPSKDRMFGLDLLIGMRDGRVIRVGSAGRTGLIGLPRVAEELYRSARVLRLFTYGRRVSVDPAALAGIATWSREEASERTAAGRPILPTA
jgi:HD superfamily phosphohydrolase